MSQSPSSSRTGKRRRLSARSVFSAALGVFGLVPLFVVAASIPAGADTTYSETVGSIAHTWTNYTDAGGAEGSSIAEYQTVQINCVVQGFKVADGNTNWYQIASSPWNDAYYVSADAFYNNGATSGSLQGTPFVDPRVPACGSSPAGQDETAGSVAHTWTNYTNAGGTEGPSIAAYQAVLVSCRLTGFKVADGNTWWYQISSAPWSNNYYVSADAFYNNGATSGSLHGTPFVDQTVPVCAGNSGGGTGIKPPALANPTYNRTKAVAWAKANANDPQAYPAMCTWFVSNALWASGFAKTADWTSAGSHGKTPITKRPGTVDAWAVPNFVSYLRSHYSTTWTSLGNLSDNSVPQAQPGDIIVYSWDGGKTLEHMSFVVGLASGDYPLVSEWGTPDWTLWTYAYYEVHHPREGYTERGWTWSQANNEWLQKERKGQAREIGRAHV